MLENTQSRDSLFQAAFLMLLTRFGVKLLGVVSTLILVRILSPEDFGIVAVSMATYAFIELFGNFGFNTALIQKSNLVKSDYDTIFTINLIFGSIASCLLFFCSASVATFLKDSRLESVFQWISLMFVINSLINVKIVDFQKDMNFKKELKFQMWPKFISFFVTISLALWLQTYWALIYGMLLHSLLNLFFSYLMLPYLPGFSLKKASELFSFSKWIMLNNFFSYLNNRSVDLIVGKMISTKAAGLYSISQEMATIPVSEIAAPINKASYPAYAAAKENSTLLASLYYRTISLITLLGLPICLGLYSVSDVFVPVVLGDKWNDTIDIIKYLSIASFFTSLATNGSYVFMAIGRPQIGTLLVVTRSIILFTLFYLIITPNNISNPALAMTISAGINLVLSYSLLIRLTKISINGLFSSTYRAVISSIIMLNFVLLAKSSLLPINMSPASMLIILVLIGGLVYVTTIISLWMLNGKPESVEKGILRKIKLIK